MSTPNDHQDVAEDTAGRFDADTGLPTMPVGATSAPVAAASSTAARPQPAVPVPPPAPVPYTSPSPADGQAQGLAIGSLVASLVGFGIVGVVLGHLALRRTPRTGSESRGMAIAGLVIGYVSIGITAVALLLFVVWMVMIGGVFLLLLASSAPSM